MFKAISLTLLFSALASAQGASDLASLLGATDQLSTLTSVVMGFPSILSTLTGFPTNLTILAPSNAAFEKMLADKSTGLSMAMANNDTEWISTLLTYHVLNGTFFSTAFKEGMTAAGPSLLMDNEEYANLGGMSQVVLGRVTEGDVMLYSGLGMASGVETADVQFDGGVVHIIDTVLTLPMKISETAAHFNLTALAGALASAELVETVDTTPSLTVFAPTNAAFEAVPNADQLTKEQLTGVLTYHVVSGPPMYDFGTEGGEMTTLQGGKIVVSKKGDDWYANDAKIMGGTEGGVVVGNGVVYVIEGVLMPSSSNNTPPAGTPTPPEQGASSRNTIGFGAAALAVVAAMLLV